MWRDRLIRIAVVVFVGLLVFGLIKTQVRRRQENPEVLGLSIEPVKEKIEDIGEKILKEAVKRLPKAPDLEKVAGEQDSQEEQVVQEEIEPIKKPIQNVQTQTQTLIETIKQLPQDQIEAIKKQIFKEICEVVGE